MFKKTVFFSLLSLSSFAQTIEKVIDFKFSDYEKIAYRPSLVGIDFNKTTKVVSIYGWQPVSGQMKTVSNEKKKGGFMSKLSTFSGLSTFGGNAPQFQGLPMLFIKNFDALGNKISEQRELIATTPLKAEEKYTFETTGYASPDLALGMAITTDFTTIATKYPALPIGQPKIVDAALGYEGEGFTGSKNTKGFVNLQVQQVSINNDLSLARTYEIKAPQKSKNMTQLGSLVAPRTSFKLHDTKYSCMASFKKDEEDRYSTSKNFVLVTFNENGDILNKTELNYDFIRDIAYAHYVYDEAGEKKGLLYILKPTTIWGNKALKDPKQNRYNLIYFDMEGVVKMKYDIEYGNPENNRCFSPLLVIEKDNQLSVWNTNYDKGSKPFLELITLDNKGVVGTIANTQSLDLKGFSLGNYDPNRNDFNVKKMHNGNFLLIGQEATLGQENPATFTRTATYTGLLLTEIKPDFTIVNSIKIPQNATQPAEYELLTTTGDFTSLVINGSYLLKMADKPLLMPLGSKDLITPKAFSEAKNYAYNADEKKLYVIFESRKIGEGKLQIISLK